MICLWGIISCVTKDPYDPDKYLSAEEKDSVLNMIIRYVTERPKGVSDEGKFDVRHNTWYERKISEARLERFYKEDTRCYFLVSQPAPSLTVKRHATGGWFVCNKDGNLTGYEEVFRTWKMVPDTLKVRGPLLFARMVRGESLEPFYTKNSKGKEFIEFPDDLVYYDQPSRAWKVRN